MNVNSSRETCTRIEGLGNTSDIVCVATDRLWKSDKKKKKIVNKIWSTNALRTITLMVVHFSTISTIFHGLISSTFEYGYGLVEKMSIQLLSSSVRQSLHRIRSSCITLSLTKKSFDSSLKVDEDSISNLTTNSFDCPSTVDEDSISDLTSNSFDCSPKVAEDSISDLTTSSGSCMSSAAALVSNVL